MPVADGYVAAAGIRELESRAPGGQGGAAAPRVPVVVCTASCLDDPAEGGPAGQTVAQRALALGADGAVRKPLTMCAVQCILDTYAPAWRAPTDGCGDVPAPPPAPSPSPSPSADGLQPHATPPAQRDLGPPLPGPWRSPSPPMRPAALLTAAAAAVLSPFIARLPAPFARRGEPAPAEWAAADASSWPLARPFCSIRNAASAAAGVGAKPYTDEHGPRAVVAAAAAAAGGSMRRLQRRMSCDVASLRALRAPGAPPLLQQQA